MVSISARGARNVGRGCDHRGTAESTGDVWGVPTLNLESGDERPVV